MSRMTILFKNCEKSDYLKVAYNFSNNCCYCIEKIPGIYLLLVAFVIVPALLMISWCVKLAWLKNWDDKIKKKEWFEK